MRTSSRPRSRARTIRQAHYPLGLRAVEGALGGAVAGQGVGRDPGADEPGADQGDTHAAVVDLGPERVEEAVEGVLGGGVAAPQRRADLPDQARDDDDPAAAAREHCGQQGLGQGDGAEVVDLHDPPVDGEGGLLGPRALADAAVVDQEVDGCTNFPRCRYTENLE